MATSIFSPCDISNRLVSNRVSYIVTAHKYDTVQYQAIFMIVIWAISFIQCIPSYNVLLVQQPWIKYSVLKLTICDTIKLNNSHRTLRQNFATFFRAPTLFLVRLLLKIKNASLVQRCPLPRGSADNLEMYSRRLPVCPRLQTFPASKEKALELCKYYSVHNILLK